MRAASTACTVAGTWMLGSGLRQAIRPRLADQHPGLHQGAHALFQEEGIALGARNQELLERRQAGVIPQQGLQELVGAHRRQRVEPQLRVVGLAAPAVLVLGAVVHQEQEPGRRQALDQAIEQGLGLGINPVQILEDQQQRLHLAFAQQHPFEAVERALAALRRVEGAETGCPPAGRPAAPAGRERVLEGLIQRQHLPGHLARMVRASSRSSIWTVALEQVDAPGSTGSPCRRTPRRSRAPASPGCGGSGRHSYTRRDFPTPGLPEQRHHLAMPGAPPAASACCRPPAPAAVPRSGSAPARPRLQAPADRTGPDQLKDLHGLGQPFDRQRPQGV